MKQFGRICTAFCALCVFACLLAENKAEPFKLTYADQGSLYIEEGYGARLTTGYSVEVNGLQDESTKSGDKLLIFKENMSIL